MAFEMFKPMTDVILLVREQRLCAKYHLLYNMYACYWLIYMHVHACMCSGFGVV